MNFHKSSIVFSKEICNTRRQNIAGIFNMHTSMSLGRYLGAHFSTYKLTKTNYNIIMQKNKNRINMWHANYLSKAGRLTLVQSNLEALPAYVCSSFLLP